MENKYKNSNNTDCSEIERNSNISFYRLPMKPYIKVMLLVFLFISFFAFESLATHGRYGNINWRPIPDQPGLVEFKVSLVYRKTFFYGINESVIGRTLTVSSFNHGDGSSRNIPLVITSESRTEDWIFGEATFTKQYANPNGNYVAFFQFCCRLSSLLNNRDATFRIETGVNLGTGNLSPISTLQPIISLPQGLTNATFLIPAFDPNGDNLTFSLTPSTQMGASSSNPTGFSVNPESGLASFNTNRSLGLYSVAVTIHDSSGARVPVDFLIRIIPASSNNPPYFVYPPTPVNASVIEVNKNETVSFNIKGEDPDDGNIVSLQATGVPLGASFTPNMPITGEIGEAVETAFSWTPTESGNVLLNFSVTDNFGAQAITSVTIVVLEYTCDLDISAESTSVTCVGGNNGTITLTTSGGTEPYEFSLDGGLTYQDSNVFSDVEEGNYTIVVRDANGCTEETTVDVGQQNDLPVIQNIIGPTDPVSISSASVQFEAEVVDDNLVLAVWDWGDGETSLENDPGNKINGSHTYTQAGVYPVTLTITDFCGETSSMTFEYVVVYDPNGGFVTGGGWIYSPPGAYIDNPDAEGKASFGFVSKYKKGADVPDGQTQFQFQSEKFNFHSTAYEWLVVAGHRAQFKGEGRVNGNTGYGFILTAIDGDRMGNRQNDRFRIKIWELSSESVVYDNQIGASDDSDSSTELGGGSIVIHDGGQNGNPNRRMIDIEAGLLEVLDEDKREFKIHEINAYPTLLEDHGVWIEIPAMERGHVVTTQIFDTNGRIMTFEILDVKAMNELVHYMDFNHHNWSKGVYILKVNTDLGVKTVKLFKR